MGAEVWDITRNQAYEVVAVRTTPLQVSEHEANAKAVNALFASVSRAEFSRVQGFQEAHKIWTCLDVQSFSVDCEQGQCEQIYWCP